MIDLVELRDPYSDYATPDLDRFEHTPEEYIKITKKLVNYFRYRLGAQLTKNILRSDDAISNLATHVMLADWRWSPEHTNAKSKKSYRAQCCWWALQGLVKRLKRKSNQLASLSMEIGENQDELINVLIDETSESPEEIAIKNETKKQVEELLASPVVSPRQAEFIKKRYLEEMNLADIGREYNISREAVRQTIERGLNKLREAAKV